MRKMTMTLVVLAIAFIVTPDVSVKPMDSNTCQNYIQVACPNCGGNKVVCVGYDYFGNPMWQTCGYCSGQGWVYQQEPQYNPTFEGRQPYYAECNRCDCKLFIPERKGSTKCTCGHLKSAQTKRYL